MSSVLLRPGNKGIFLFDIEKSIVKKLTSKIASRPIEDGSSASDNVTKEDKIYQLQFELASNGVALSELTGSEAIVETNNIATLRQSDHRFKGIASSEEDLRSIMPSDPSVTNNVVPTIDTNRLHTPDEGKRILEAMRDNREVLTLILNDTSETDYPQVLITSIEFTKDANNPNTSRRVSMTLQEFQTFNKLAARLVSLQSTKVEEASQDAAASESDKGKQSTRQSTAASNFDIAFNNR